MPNVIDDLSIQGVATHGYSGWILVPSGVAVHSTLDATAETLTNSAELKVGYSGWILVPSGLNIPSIDEDIVFNGDLLTNVGTASITIDEVIEGTPTPEPIIPVPVPTSGGTYAPIFPVEIPKLVPIKEIVTNKRSSSYSMEEFVHVTDAVITQATAKNTVTGTYRKVKLIAIPTLPDFDFLPPKETFVQSKFPDELPTGLTAEQRRKKQQQQAFFLGLI